VICIPDVGLYDSDIAFFRDMIRDVVMHRLNRYENTIKKFERKYTIEFQEFSDQLAHGAAIEEEDDRMEWEAAINMLGAWRRVAGSPPLTVPALV